MQLEGVKTQLTTASNIGERYWMATLLLTVIIIACIGVIYHRQMEVINCQSKDTESRGKIESLVEQKGANEEKRSHALTLKEQADQFLNRMFSKEDRLIEDAKDCQKFVRQLVQNVTALTGERDDAEGKYKTCFEQLTACEEKIK